MTKEAVQIVEIQQPICGNTFGVLPCTATGEKCYNTRATCKDEPNFRYTPEWLLTATFDAAQGDTVTSSDVDLANPIFAAFDVIIPNSADGVIWEQGGSAGNAAYLGFTSGNLIWRVGSGTVSSGALTAKVSVSATPYEGQDITFIVAGNATTNNASLWVWDNTERTLELVGSDTASGGFSAWAGSNDGGVGTVSGTVATGESADDFNGVISRATFYDNTPAPDMDVEWRIRLFFSKGNMPDRNIEGAPFIRPSLAGVSTSPTRINLASSNPDAGGLGNRALVNVSFNDHPDTDKIVDPYLSSRTWDPFSRGSFWTKWPVRNKYRQNFLMKIYTGVSGQSLADMDRKLYFLSSTKGPNAGGGFQVSGKDVLAYAEERKAQAPTISIGKLFTDIDSTVTSFEVVASEADYPATGTIRIDKEVMTYSARVASANGVTFTITLRETDGTTADEHEADALVQECLRYTDQNADQICKDLLNTYALIPTKYMNLDLWKSETDSYLSGFLLSTLITAPTPVTQLVSELQRDVGFSLWWDDRSSLIDMKAVRGVDALPPLLSAEDNIIDGSFSLSEKPRERLSQVWLYFSQKDAAEDLAEVKNFQFAQIQADLEAEGEDQYGESQIKTIKSRWIRSTAQALSTASKIVVRYRDTPRECTFLVDVKDREHWTGSVVRVSHYLDVDQHGERNISNWFVLSAEEVSPNHTIKLMCQDITLYGIITLIQADSTPDYQGDGSDAYTGAFIGDADGLLSDGTNSGRIT